MVIATPHTSHLSLVAAAAATGRHVLLEKPMGVSLADCDAMIAACETAGATFMVAHISRFLPAVRQAFARIAQGEIGEPRMVVARRLVDGYPNSGWPLDSAEGSAFLDWGSHGCDLMRWLVGAEPEIAFGRTASYRGTAPAALSAMAVFGFEGGRMGHVWQSYEMAGPGVLARARYLVIGSAGTLDCHAYGQLELDRGGTHRTVYQADDFPGAGGAADMDGPTFRGAFRDQLQGFADAIAAGAPPPVTARDRHTAVAMVLRRGGVCRQRPGDRRRSLAGGRAAAPSREGKPRPLQPSDESHRSASARRSATHPASSARLPHQIDGIASSTPAGSSQRRSFHAAQAMSAAANGSRTMSGMGTDPGTVDELVDDFRRSNQACHSPGAMSAETATIAAVVAPAMASCRHSRRTTNHSRPRPGVTFVSTGSAQVPHKIEIRPPRRPPAGS